MSQMPLTGFSAILAAARPKMPESEIDFFFGFGFGLVYVLPDDEDPRRRDDPERRRVLRAGLFVGLYLRDPAERR